MENNVAQFVLTVLGLMLPVWALVIDVRSSRKASSAAGDPDADRGPGRPIALDRERAAERSHSVRKAS
jgi:hypothetical protein